jgi:hypothetical protein
VLRGVGRFAAALVLYPLRSALLLVNMVIGLVTALVTALLVAYFCATTMFAGADLLQILNSLLQGRFTASFVNVDILSQKVDLFDLTIADPEGNPVIESAHVHTSIDLVRLGFFGVRSALGVPGPIPLHFPDTEVEDFNVSLVFPEEGGVRLASAFTPREPPEPGPPGPQPLLTFNAVAARDGNVELVFPDWRMDIRAQLVPATLRIDDGKVFIGSKDIRVTSFRLTGALLPENLRFLGEASSSVWVRRFTMNHLRMEVEGASIHQPDAGIEADLIFDAGKPRIPAAGRAKVSLHAPERLEELTAGQVFGTATATVRLKGYLTRPDLDVEVASPLLMVQDLDLEDVSAVAALRLAGKPRIELASVDATHAGSAIHVGKGRVLFPPGPVRVEADACFEPLSPALVAERFDVLALLPALDATAGGCVSGLRLSVGEEGVRLTADAEVAGYPGALAASMSGAQAYALSGKVRVLDGRASWDDLVLATDVAGLSSSGSLDWSDELAIDAGVDGAVPDIRNVHVAPLDRQLAALRLSGSVDIDAARISGPVGNLRVEAEIQVRNLAVLGTYLGDVLLDAGYWNGKVDTRLLCIDSPAAGGCVRGTADVSAATVAARGGVPVHAAVTGPMTLSLGDLPFADLPLTGLAEVTEAEAQLVLSPDPDALISSISGRADVMVHDLAVTDVTVAKTHVRVEKLPAEVSGSMAGGLEGQLAFENMCVGDTTVEWGDVQLSLSRFSAPAGTALFPSMSGTALVRLLRVRNGPHWLSAFTAVIDAFDDPGRLSLSGASSLYKKVGVNFLADVDTVAETASMRASVDRVSLALLPIPGLDAGLRAMLKPTRLSGALRIQRIDVRSLAEGNLTRFLRSLRLEGDVKLIGMELFPEPSESLEANLVATSGTIRLNKLLLKMLNGSRVRANGTLDPRSMKLKASLSVTPTRLSSLDLVAAAGLPLDAVVGVQADLSGRLTSPDVVAAASIRDLQAAGLTLGDADVALAGRVGEMLKIASPSFFSGFSLKEGALAFENGLPSVLTLGLGFERLDLRTFVRALPETVSVGASGDAILTVDMRGPPNEPFVLSATVPQKQAKACVQLLDWGLCMTNPAPAAFRVTAKGVAIEGLALSGEGQMLTASGSIRFDEGWDVRLQLGIDVAQVPLLSDVLASYSGTVAAEGEGLHFTGDLASPEIDGALLFADLDLLPRNFGTNILVSQARIGVMGGLATGNLVAIIEEDSPILGEMEDGRFRAHGWFRLLGFKPRSGMLSLSGQNVYYQVPGQYELVVSPDLELSLEKLDDPDLARSRLSGSVYVAEGEYSRNFDRLLGSFQSAFDRSQERYSKPLTELFPFLKTLELDVAVSGGNFAVATRFPFGETELTVNLDLRVAGTLSDLRLYDRMTLVPGGIITYKLVRREFEVTRGTVDFTGDPAAPYLDIEARTSVDYRPQATGSFMTAAQRQQLLQGIPVVIQLVGVYPDLTPSFTSPDHPEYDTADLQMLLLLGKTRRDLEGQSGDSGASPVSINILTDDVAGLVSKLVLAPFVDAVSLGLTNDGGFRAEAATHVGRAMQLTTTVQQGTDQSEYSAGFVFRITDALTLEGAIKSVETKGAQGQQQPYKSYEGKFRYSIPLE